MGQVAFAPDVSNAASDNISISLTGRGGHGAQPQACVDPIVAGAYLVTQLQSIISRSIAPVDSAVLTIGSFHSGTARNIIPQEAILEGTLRTLSNEVRERVLGRLQEMVRGLETAHQVAAELKVSVGYPLLVNDPGIVRFVERQARELLGDGFRAPGATAHGFRGFCLLPG